MVQQVIPFPLEHQAQVQSVRLKAYQAGREVAEEWSQRIIGKENYLQKMNFCKRKVTIA